MKRLLTLIFIGLCVCLQISANGKIAFSISGLQQNDKSTVSLGSDNYLNAQTITADGNYSFTNVPVGRFFIKIEATGYNIPNAQEVIVKEDGSIQPSANIRFAITKMVDDPTKWTHSWNEDVSNSGYTTSATINTPPEIEFLGKKIVPANVPSVGLLLNKYNIILSDEGGENWTQEYSYRLLETLKTIPYIYTSISAKFVLTKSSINDDIKITDFGNGKEITISIDAFYYANPFLVNLDGIRGRFFSKRLHHALVNYVTNFGADENAVDNILKNRFGCTTNIPDYIKLTSGTTNEDKGRFQKFHPTELVSIINMFEEMPEGFHKISHLNYLVRRLNGHKHPLYPEAAAVAWPVDNGYIEFMESAFSGNNQAFETLRLILHEKTHFLWAYSFPNEIKNDWIKLGGWYEDPNASDGWSTTQNTEFVSNYAHAKNPNEDMAESVAYYIKNPELLQSRSIKKYEFIRDRIMHGTRYISTIPGHLTFEVLNLNPDYSYPGKIKRLDVAVTGSPKEDKTVTVEIELNHMEGFSDGASRAYTRITSPSFKGTNGDNLTQMVDLEMLPINNNPYILRGSLTLSKNSKMGYWTAGDITVTDIHGNQRFEGRNDCVWNMYVNNPMEDVEPPVYIENSLNYALMDTVLEGHKAQNLRITFDVKDNVGFYEDQPAVIRLASGDKVSSPNYSNDTYGRYIPETGKMEINHLITEYYQSTDYFVTFLTLYDLARNVTNVRFSDSPQDHPIKKIHITTSNPDSKAPELDLNRITVSAAPTNKEAPDGETLVTINYYARDDKSGLGHVKYTLRDPQGINHYEYHYHENYHTIYFKGDPTIWKKYTVKCILPKGSAPGIWGLAEMVLIDKAQNEKTYNFVETLIFEPDNSESDYMLFSEIGTDGLLNLEIESNATNHFGFTYRIINEDTGEEISGDVNTSPKNRNASFNKNIAIDISTLSNGPILIIAQIKNKEGNIEAVRSSRFTKGTATDIQDIQKTASNLIIRGGINEVTFMSKDSQDIIIYNINGQMVRRLTITEGFTKVNIMPGIYIINNTKCIVR